MPEPPFSALASVYDVIMQDVPYAAWVDFALAGARARGWSGGRVLELGCGTGNATVLLVRHGLEVVGVDASPAMLAVARQKLPETELVVGDAREVALPGRFGLALAVFDVVNNLLDDGDLATVARRVHRHLLPGGVWAFDANTAAGLTEPWAAEVVEGWAGGVHYRWRHRWDHLVQRATLEAWCAPAAGAPFTEVHQERPYGPEELRRLLLDAGFEGVDAVRFPQGDAATEDDPRIWVFARRGSDAAETAGARAG